MRPGEQASVRPAGQLRVNNGEAVLPALIAGLGIADLPEFIVGDAIASGEVEVILKGWKQTEGAVHLVHATRRPAPRPRRGAGGFSGQAFCQGEEADVAVSRFTFRRYFAVRVSGMPC